MRIAFVSNLLPPEGRGGAEYYVARLVETLAARHEVTVFTGSLDGEAGAAAVVHVPSLYSLSTAAHLPEKIMWHARDQWSPTVHRALKGMLASFAPAVVHTHEPQGLTGAVFTAVASCRLPHVHTAHDLNLLCAQVTMTRNGVFCGGRCVRCAPQRALRPRLLRRRLDTVICHSEYLHRRHAEAGVCSPEKIVTIPFGVPDTEGRVRSPNSHLRLGFVGSLTRQKGLVTLLDTFRSCPPHWTLAIAGAGPLEGLVRTRAGLDRRIEFVGYVSGPEKDAFFDAIDLLVIPSEMEEATSLVAVEAGARGIPSVVSNRGGLPEFPEALVFEAGSGESLQAALWMHGATPERLEQSSRALLDMRDRFAWNTHVRRVEEVLEAAASRRASAPAEAAPPV